MSTPYTIDSKRLEISRPTYTWKTNHKPFVNEGPQVIAHDQTINLVFSASGSWTNDYCMGLITAHINSVPMNSTSWRKRVDPILKSGNRLFGPGHGSLTRNNWLVFHTAIPVLGELRDPNIPISLPQGDPLRQRYQLNSPVQNPIFDIEVDTTGWYIIVIQVRSKEHAKTTTYLMTVNKNDIKTIDIFYSDNWSSIMIPVELLKGKNTSSVWNYFKRVSINGVNRAECLQKECGKTFSLVNWSTSALFKHLRDIHKIENLKKNTNGRVIIGRIQHKLSKAQKKKLDSLAIEAIIKDGRSFNDFNKTGLKRFLQYAIPGYNPIHRNNVHENLRKLYLSHRKIMINDLSNVSDIAITVDFWSDRKSQSYLVLTGHYVDEAFKSISTVLQFSTFDKRHFSDLIGKEIEQQLIDLNIFHKVTTITCDNAPNMLGLFQHLSRDIIRIPCMAHVLHLILCNGLNIWETGEVDDSNNTTAKRKNNKEKHEFDEGLSQSVRKMSIGGDDVSTLDQQNSQDSEEDVSGVACFIISICFPFQISEDEIESDEENGAAEGAEGTETNGGKDSEKKDGEDEIESDDSDFEDDKIEDNFQFGVVTNAADTQERASIIVERQIGYILRSK
ncbi:unnamed protein product [Adineta steineri]|uniref:Uncharacterized protein n=2 Tax=Adineta steineri TaxID=433720 RepID=A0A814YJR3_9BILA|nr:unnamed protein product [Adineta steineri]